MFTVLDGKLHVYQRLNSRFWQCGFHHNGVYIRASTKCADRNKATESAKQWFYRKQAELASGVPVAAKKDTFGYFAELAVEDYRRLAKEGKASPAYAHGIKVLIENHLKPFFGSYPLTSVNQLLWHKFQTQYLAKKKISGATTKQYLNGIRVVFRRAQIRGEISEVPKLVTERKTVSDDTPRTWFSKKEYQTLFLAIRKNIKKHATTRWRKDAEELRDYVQFMVSSGLRIGEAKNLRFCDVEIEEDKYEKDALGEPRTYLILRNLKGKRGRGTCKTHFGAAAAFEDTIQRRGLSSTWGTSEEKVFLHHHRDMFNSVLEECKLKFTKDVPIRKRDLMSLRHTYICNRLMDGAGVWDIAANCRTSVAMIENHYARWLGPEKSNINAGLQGNRNRKRPDFTEEGED